MIEVPMDSSSTTYTIQNLTDLTSVPRRTIHFYTQQGILPPPQGAGVGTEYSEDHLLRLRLIPILRSEGMRLDQIRQYFQSTDPIMLRQRLENAPAPIPPSPAPGSAQGVSYTHYSLPLGLTLIVPANLPANQRQKIEHLVEEAVRILLN